jgi:GNAT superfamily N-acetyltransferase
MLGQLGALLADETATNRPAAEPAQPEVESKVRVATADDRSAIAAFLDAMAPELEHALPPASELLLAEAAGHIVGLASWAPWDRPRTAVDPRGFDGLTLPDGERPAEMTLLAVAPSLRGRGIGRGLTDSIAEAAGAAGCTRLMAWTLGDAAIHPSSVAARTFFRSNGFTDLAVDRSIQARGEDRLLLSRPLD